ncbi:hypothetical protein GWI33_018414 [Rhynchophorus ferrugineus]|uniref:Uncharacterized protein n=1 Tax=Rhynchophorus ferrugineus TaxID=354439 RepID=A0A834I7J4_RHYFE|nr:hypothetical protein GWI33_018414 [Rhynchophorus ferrugineus]
MSKSVLIGYPNNMFIVIGYTNDHRRRARIILCKILSQEDPGVLSQVHTPGCQLRSRLHTVFVYFGSMPNKQLFL